MHEPDILLFVMTFIEFENNIVPFYRLVSGYDNNNISIMYIRLDP